MKLAEYLDSLKLSLAVTGDLRLSVWVRCGSGRTMFKDIVIETDEKGNSHYHLKLSVNAVPENNKANREIKNFVVEYFDVPKSHVEILSGLTNTKKLISVKTGLKIKKV